MTWLLLLLVACGVSYIVGTAIAAWHRNERERAHGRGWPPLVRPLPQPPDQPPPPNERLNPGAF